MGSPEVMELMTFRTTNAEEAAARRCETCVYEEKQTREGFMWCMFHPKLGRVGFHDSKTCHLQRAGSWIRSLFGNICGSKGRFWKGKLFPVDVTIAPDATLSVEGVSDG